MIVRRSAEILGIQIDTAGTNEIAARSRGTPRVANRLLRRVRDYAQVKANGVINREVACQSLALLAIDDNGFDENDKKFDKQDKKLDDVHNRLEQLEGQVHSGVEKETPPDDDGSAAAQQKRQGEGSQAACPPAPASPPAPSQSGHFNLTI